MLDVFFHFLQEINICYNKENDSIKLSFSFHPDIRINQNQTSKIRKGDLFEHKQEACLDKDFPDPRGQFQEAYPVHAKG